MTNFRFLLFRDECEIQVKGFGGAVFKKFKSHQQAQAFIEGQPTAKKHKIQNKTSFVKAIPAAQSKVKVKPKEDQEISDDSDDGKFLSLQEYPDEPPKKLKKSSSATSTSKSSSAASSSKSSSVVSTSKSSDPLSIKFEPPLPTSRKSYNGHFFNEDIRGFVHVYTDGSCESNGKYSAAAGFGVYFGEDHILNVSEAVTGRPTNNVGEIQAAIRAIKDAQSYEVKRLNIFTDSQFLINSVCKWMVNWRRKDWKLANGKEVVNVKDFMELDHLIESGDMLIKWSYIPAHKGYDGNEKADQLAKTGASMYRTKKEKAEDDENGGSDSEKFSYQ